MMKVKMWSIFIKIDISLFGTKIDSSQFEFSDFQTIIKLITFL